MLKLQLFGGFMALDPIQEEIVRKDPSMKEVFEFLEKNNDPSKWLYGSAVRDRILLHDPISLPRFRHLARKAFIRYAGDRYNPHTVSEQSEIFIRRIISWMIEYKVEGRVKEYDWELIDNFLLGCVYDTLDLELPADYVPIDREVLPEFRSPFHGKNNEPIN